MATINNNMHKVNGVWYCKIEGTRLDIPARAVTDYYTKQFCKVLKWTYTDGVNDGGIDAVTPKGTKHIQFKVMADNRSSVTFSEVKYSTKENALDCDLEKMLDLLREYAEKFDELVIYTTVKRGDKFNKANAERFKGEDIVKWLYEHGDISYMNVGKTYYRQIKFSKRAKRAYNG